MPFTSLASPTRPKNLEKSSIIKVKLRRATPEVPEEKALLKNTAVETLKATPVTLPRLYSTAIALIELWYSVKDLNHI